MCNLKILPIILVLFSYGNAYAGVELNYVSVEAEGRGITVPQAINAALIEAIGRVNGKSLSAKTSINKVSQSVKSGRDKSYYSSTKMQRAYKEATKGIVGSYEVLSQRQGERKNWIVVVRAQIAKFKLTGSAKRLKIAVLPFTVNRRGINVKIKNVNPREISRSFNDSLNDKLVGSRRFAVLDRQNMDQTLGEKELALNSPTISVAEIARLGHQLVADYVVVGRIENLEYRIKSTYFKFLKKKFSTPVGSVAISYRVVEIATGQVKFSDKALIDFSSNDFEKIYKNRLPPAPVVAVLELASISIGKKMLNGIYPILLAAASKHEVTLNQGGDTIQNGEIYTVFERGESIKDPYTKEFLGYKETAVAQIRIVRVTSKFSTAKILSSKINLNKRFQPKRYVVMLTKVPVSRRNKKDKKAVNQVKKLETKSKDDW